MEVVMPRIPLAGLEHAMSAKQEGDHTTRTPIEYSALLPTIVCPTLTQPTQNTAAP